MDFSRIQDEQLIYVVVAEEYALKHNEKMEAVLKLFAENGVFDVIKSQYEVLHMLDFDESLQYVEDVLRGKSA